MLRFRVQVTFMVWGLGAGGLEHLGSLIQVPQVPKDNQRPQRPVIQEYSNRGILDIWLEVYWIVHGVTRLWFRAS